jgi:hypothetical protein
VFIEYWYDNGYVYEHKQSNEQFDAASLKISDKLILTYFPYVANAFLTQCRIDLVLGNSSALLYKSDADVCNEDLEMNCDCVFEEECVLCYSDNPMINNSSVGFQYDSHCKSITRLRNNLIIGIPESTIRFGFTGHDPCYASSRTEHSFNGPQALSDYNYPIICSTVGQQEDNTYGILVMLHELSHLYGVIVHHDPDLNHRCVVERSDNNPTRYQYNDPEDPNTIWCPRCIDTIRTNGNNY